jgi:ABC-type nickel/cobalt efflux system permease component RcnA
LLRLFLHSEHGFWMMLLLAAGFGAAHALTPGHGKTLVAAYLVGQRGTVWHALLLGMVTTLTHTGVVLVLAAALQLFFPHGMTEQTQRDVDTALGLVGGLLIAGLGVWLLLRRLSGQADHFHLPGHSHHHHHHHDGAHSHDHADHYHDEHGHTHPLPQDGGAWGLVVLGIHGGIVPCWDAVILLLAAVAMNLLWLALPLLLAFSAGLAGVLILIGILVVKARGLAGARWGENRLFRMLPLLSALVIIGLGLWLCYDRVHARAAPASSAMSARP